MLAVCYYSTASAHSYTRKTQTHLHIACSHAVPPPRYLGLPCHLILRTSRHVVDHDPGLVGNLLVERMAGAHLHLVGDNKGFVCQGSQRSAYFDTCSSFVGKHGSKP